MNETRAGMDATSHSNPPEGLLRLNTVHWTRLFPDFIRLVFGKEPSGRFPWSENVSSKLVLDEAGG